MVKKRKRNAQEMEKKRFKRNVKETLTAFFITLSTYTYTYTSMYTPTHTHSAVCLHLMNSETP